MTVYALCKILNALVTNGHARTQVCIDKSSFTHPLESDGACILNVTSAEIERTEMMDDDGGRKELANGQTAERTFLVLKGEQ